VAAAGVLNCVRDDNDFARPRPAAEKVMPPIIEEEIERLAPAKALSGSRALCITIIRHWRGSLGSRCNIARTALGKRGMRPNARASRDGAPGKRPHRSRSHCSIAPLLGLIGAVSGLVTSFLTWD